MNESPDTQPRIRSLKEIIASMSYGDMQEWVRYCAQEEVSYMPKNGMSPALRELCEGITEGVLSPEAITTEIRCELFDLFEMG